MRSSYMATVIAAAVVVLGCAGDGGASSDAAGDSAGPDAFVASDGADGADVGDSAAATDTVPAGDTSAPALASVTDRGPWNVGFRTWEITWTPAAGQGDGPPAERSNRVALWYPTDAEAGPSATYGGILPRAEVIADAEPGGEGQLPVIIFSHGSNGFAEQSWFLTEFFASHGFVVAAIDHTGNTFRDLEGPIPLATFYLRPWDISALLDDLEELPVGDPIAGRMDLDAVAVMGHSFGGYTSLMVGGATWDIDALLSACAGELFSVETCDALRANQEILSMNFYDSRVKAIVPMAPGATFLLARGLSDVVAPTLLVTGGLDHTTGNATEGDPAWLRLGEDPANIRVDFATAGHFTFSNACSLPLGIGDDDGCSEENIDADDAHWATNAYALAFVRWQLQRLGRDSVIAADAEPLLDDITLSFGAAAGAPE